MQIQQTTFDNDAVYIDARIFNPLDDPVSLADETLWLITGYTPSPAGPQIAPVASDLPQRIEAGTAFDLNLTFPYSSEPYARLHLLNREYALQLAERR